MEIYFLSNHEGQCATLLIFRFHWVIPAPNQLISLYNPFSKSLEWYSGNVFLSVIIRERKTNVSLIFLKFVILIDSLQIFLLAVPRYKNRARRGKWCFSVINMDQFNNTQPIFTRSKTIMKMPEQCMKFVQS